MKDIKNMNISLLAKWKWRLLYEDDLFWRVVLVGKYGPRVGRRVELGGGGGRHILLVGGEN